LNTRTGVTASADAKLATVAVDADLVLAAFIATVTAVHRIIIEINTRVVAFLGVIRAVRNTFTVETNIRAVVAWDSTVIGIGSQIDTISIDKRETGSANTTVINAILIVIALMINGTAVVRIAGEIKTIIAFKR